MRSNDSPSREFSHIFCGWFARNLLPRRPPLNLPLPLRYWNTMSIFISYSIFLLSADRAVLWNLYWSLSFYLFFFSRDSDQWFLDQTSLFARKILNRSVQLNAQFQGFFFNNNCTCMLLWRINQMEKCIFYVKINWFDKESLLLRIRWFYWENFSPM